MADGAKILLMIEPNDDKFTSYSTVLQNEGLDIKRAVSAADATKAIEEIMPAVDIVLLNWSLPDANGFAYAQKLRQNELMHAAQFIICTKTMSDDDLVLLAELDIYHWFNSNNNATGLIDKINAAKKDANEVSAVAKAIKKFDRAVSKEDLKYAKELLNHDSLEQSIRANPRYHFCLAEFFILSREPDKAVALLSETLKSQAPKGDNIKNYTTLGKAYCMVGKNTEALEIFQKLAAKSPKNFSHKILLGDAHLGLNQIDKAREQYEGVLSSDPTNRDALVGTAKADIADNDIEGAQTIFAQIKEPFESYTLASFFNNRAIALTKASKHDEAVVLYENAIQFLKKYRGHVYFNLGNAYTRLGQAEKAEQAYEKAAKLGPPELLSKKRILRKMGDKGKEDFIEDAESSKKSNFSV